MAKVLVVDDDSTTRAQLQAALESAGHSVSFAANGRIATQLYARFGYDVVIMDLAMPEMNGYQAIREIKAADPGARIIAISGEDAAQLEYAAEYGATATLPKPLSPRTIQDEVDRIANDPGVWSGNRIR